jgi:hypothetical protein
MVRKFSMVKQSIYAPSGTASINSKTMQLTDISRDAGLKDIVTCEEQRGLTVLVFIVNTRMLQC